MKKEKEPYRFAVNADENAGSTGEEKVLEEDAPITVDDLEEIFNPEFLRILTEASGGFTYTLISAQDAPRYGVSPHTIGFTDMNTRRIYLVKEHALHFLQDKKIGKRQIRGFLLHEGGHHTPPVLVLDKRLRQDLGKQDLEPSELQDFFSDPDDHGKTRELYWRAVMSDCFNGVLDAWLEEYMARPPYDSIAEDFNSLYEQSQQGRSKELFLGATVDTPEGPVQTPPMPLHHQLTQRLVGEERYFKRREVDRLVERKSPKFQKELQQNAQDLLDPRVASTVEQLRKDNAFNVLMDRSRFIDPFATDKQIENFQEQKYRAAIDFFYRSWRALLLEEFERRKQYAADEAAANNETHTKEEWLQIHHKILKELLGQTEQLGQSFGIITPGKGDKKELEKIFKGIAGSAGGGRGKGEAPPSPTISDLDRMRREIQSKFDEMKRKEIKDLADRFGVSEASLRKLRDLESRHANDILRLTEALAEVFINQRLPKTIYEQTEGMITPGLEHVLVGGAMRGDHDLRVRQDIIESPEFMQTEVEFMADTSGSMQNQRLELAEAMFVIVTRAFENVKERLSSQNLLRPQEEDPLRVGYAGFSDKPYRVKKLSEPTIKDRTLAQMIEQYGKVSGGTDDAASLEALKGEFQKNVERVLKFLVVASDGEGNPDGVQKLLKEIEEDNSIIMIVVAMGTDHSAVASTYESAARRAGSSNIFVITGEEVTHSVNTLCDYLVKQIRRKAGVGD